MGGRAHGRTDRATRRGSTGDGAHPDDGRDAASRRCRALGPRREKHKDPATRVFQALRIATNRELVELERFLDDAIARLALGARLSVLSYHSLEDRIVKHIFQRHTAGCTCPPSFPVCVCSRRRVMALVTKKPIRPSLAELGDNPRARSARLRVLERVAEESGPLTPPR